MNTEKIGKLGLSVEDVFYVKKSEEASAVNIYGLSCKSEHFQKNDPQDFQAKELRKILKPG